MSVQATKFMALVATAFFFSSVCGSVATNPTVQPPSSSWWPVGANKVDVNFYYEALCYSCRNFITSDLERLYNDFGDVINLRFIPWGNAKIVNGNFVCQYGPDECYLNAVHACAIHKWPDLRTQFDFIQCSSNAYRDWTGCVSNETAHELQQCATSNLGKNLQLAFAYETQNLNPPHEFVPWATVNNVPVKKDLFSIARYICDAYKGSDPPAACNEWKARTGQGRYGANKSELETCKRS